MYRPDQIKVLERQFQENPYPDFDRFETLSKDLEIPESKLKVSERISWPSYEIIGNGNIERKWNWNASAICHKPAKVEWKIKKKL